MSTRTFSAALAGVVLVAAAHIREGIESANALYPRFLFHSIPLLEERQDGNVCNAGSHSCQAINATGCCPDDQYCFVNATGAQKCCQNGSRCEDPCPLDQYRCAISSTAACCPRPCPAPSGYQCPQSLGGNCCSVGFSCGTSSSCVKVVETSTVNIVSATPTGCFSSQFPCPANEGGGCCDNGQTCTALASRLYCAAGGSNTARETGGAALTGTAGIATSTSTSTSDSGGGGLSSGAKAGIGAGVSLGVILILGLLAWFILGRRRAAAATNSGPPVSSISSGYGHGHPVGQASPPTSTGADYFSVAPHHGQYSHSQAAGASGMGAYTPGGYTPSGRGAVPVSPQGPNDIATPVEIAESAVPSPGEISGLGSPVRGIGGDWKAPPEYTKERMELE